MFWPDEPQCKVILLGKEKAGKSALLKKITHQDPLDLGIYEKTVGVEFGRVVVGDNEIELLIWDIGYNKRHDLVAQSYYPGTQIAIYCVDLSKQNNIEQIKQHIEEYKQITASHPISKYTSWVLVGTKSDVLGHEESNRRFLDLQTRLSACVQFDSSIMTSVSDDYQINELSNCLLKLAMMKIDQVRQSLWGEALRKVRLATDGLSDQQQYVIKIQTSTLIHTINDHSLSPEIKTKAIEHYTYHCFKVLNHNHPTLMNAVLKLAAVAAIAVLTGVLGFGIGFIAGAWAGPGAFIAGFLTGSAAAVSVVAASGLALGLGIYGLFKDTKEVAAVKEFAKTAVQINAAA